MFPASLAGTQRKHRTEKLAVYTVCSSKRGLKIYFLDALPLLLILGNFTFSAFKETNLLEPPPEGHSVDRHHGSCSKAASRPQSPRSIPVSAFLVQSRKEVVLLEIGLSGPVRPRQGTEICNFGAPSPLEALHWIFCSFSRFYVQFSKKSPRKSGESSKKSS